MSEQTTSKLSAVAVQTITAIAGIILAGVVGWVCLSILELPWNASVTAAVTICCGVWWCTEAVPIPVTSLLPFAVFPFAGVLDHHELASAYGDKFILLFLSGFMLSRAAERSGTHLQLSRWMMTKIGTDSQARIVIGFLVAPAICSMWISNTATALIMLPVAIAVLQQQQNKKLAVPLLLAVAYGSSIGGIATIIGTPPNGVFVSIYEQQTSRTVDFFSWLKIGVPVSAAMLLLTGFWLTRGLNGAAKEIPQAAMAWTTAQRRVFCILVGVALLWTTRSGPWGGWSGWLDLPMVHDATVGLAAVILMFLIPNGENSDQNHLENGGAIQTNVKPGFLLDWPTASNIPWGVLILFGGGLAIAKASEQSGLSASIGDQLTLLGDFHPIFLIAAICLTVTFLTEVTSNTATTALLMPILGSAAVAAGYDASAFMVPAALSASCAFMLPVATPPNAIVFGSEQIKISDMVRTGFALNLMGAIVITAVCYLFLDLKVGLGQ